MTTMHIARRKLRLSRQYLYENGAFLLLSKLFWNLSFGFRDWSLSRGLHCSGVRLGRSPRVIGLRHITVGHDFRAGDDLWIEAVTYYQGANYNPLITIGNGVWFSDNVHIGCTSSIEIGDGVLIGSRVVIIDHNHGIYEGAVQSRPDIPPAMRHLSVGKGVVIGENVWIGDCVAILPGASIGAGSIIGANSTVTGSIPANCIAFGSPARPVRFYDSTSGMWLRRNPTE